MPSRDSVADTRRDRERVSGLDELLAPLASSDFLKDFWGRECIHVRGEPGKFRDLFSWDCLNDLLALHRLPFPRLRLAKEGRNLDPPTYQNTDNAAETEKLSACLQSGATLVLDEVECLHGPLRDCASQLESVFKVQV